MENVNLNSKLIESVNKLSDFAKNAGYDEIANTAKKIISDVGNRKFTVAVVGEFSRGKSSLLNKLFEREVLPVGNLPTTAMLTSIAYGEAENIKVYGKNNELTGEYSIDEEAWDKICENKTPEELAMQKAYVTLNTSWFKDSGIEIYDTPGAGDLEEARAKVIGDALLACDGAIITISATSPLSVSEKLFIEQRLITHKIPFLMLVVTKLDMVREKERKEILNYIKSKMQAWNMNLPVFIPDEALAPEDYDSNFAGISKIREQIAAWKNHPERTMLTEQSIVAKMMYFSNFLSEMIKEKKSLVSKNEEEIKQFVEDKKLYILKTGLLWEDLRLELDERADKCVDYLFKQMPKYTEKLLDLTKRSLDDSDDLKQWVEQVYGYTIRKELANIAADLNADIGECLSGDIGWFNEELAKQFSAGVKEKETIITDEDTFKSSGLNCSVKLGYISDEPRIGGFFGNWAMILVSSTMLSYLTGFNPILTILGVKVLSDRFNKKLIKGDIDKQKELVWNEVSADIPNIIDRATSDSRKKILTIYEEISKSSREQEKLWKKNQETLIEQATKEKTYQVSSEKYEIELNELNNLNNSFKFYLNM